MPLLLLGDARHPTHVHVRAGDKPLSSNDSSLSSNLQFASPPSIVITPTRSRILTRVEPTSLYRWCYLVGHCQVASHWSTYLPPDSMVKGLKTKACFLAYTLGYILTMAYKLLSLCHQNGILKDHITLIYILLNICCKESQLALMVLLCLITKDPNQFGWLLEGVSVLLSLLYFKKQKKINCCII